jgi:hypothetical protein
MVEANVKVKRSEFPGGSLGVPSKSSILIYVISGFPMK